MNQLTIPISPQLQSLIDARLAQGAYVDAADYVRDLLRQDARQQQELARLREAIEEGLASGVIDRDPRAIIAEIIAEDPDLCD